MNVQVSKTMGIPTPYIFLAVILLIDFFILQWLGVYAYSDTVRSYGWYIAGLQPVITYVLWALIVVIFSQHISTFSQMHIPTFRQKAGVLWSSVVIASAHRTVSTFVFFVYLRLFTDAGASDVFNRQVLWGYGIGVLESLIVFWGIIWAIRKYRANQTEIYEIRRELSNTFLGLSEGRWPGFLDNQAEVPPPSPEYEEAPPYFASAPGVNPDVGSGQAGVVQEKALMAGSRLVLNPRMGRHVDPAIVAPGFYEQFHAFLSQENLADNRIIGVTSPNPGEGTSSAAANLAVALAMGYEKKTVLIDMNVRQPRQHQVFDVSLSPGVIDALHEMRDGRIHISATQILGLFVLPAGSLYTGSNGHGPIPSVNGVHGANGVHGTNGVNGKHTNGHDMAPSKGSIIGLAQSAAFFEMISTLEKEFDHILIDMPATNSEDFPAILASRLEHILTVVNAGETKQKDIDKLFQKLNKNQILGFVLNQVQASPQLGVWGY